jgi:hypothetical protein
MIKSVIPVVEIRNPVRRRGIDDQHFPTIGNLAHNIWVVDNLFHATEYNTELHKIKGVIHA